MRPTFHGPVPGVCPELLELETGLAPRTVLLRGLEGVARGPRILVRELVDAICCSKEK